VLQNLKQNLTLSFVDWPFLISDKTETNLRLSGIGPAHAINIFQTEKFDDVCELETSCSCLVCISVWLYSPLLDLGHFSSFLSFFTQSVGLLGRRIDQSIGRYLHIGQHNTE
jgi:5'-3' exonuclease